LARRSADPVRTREKILKYATDEFARFGFGGARTDRIAARCKLSKNMLYYYFKSKEGLFIAVLERMYQTLRDNQRDLSIRASDPLRALEQLIRHTFHAFESNPNTILLLNEENKHRAKYIRKSHRTREMYYPLIDTVGLVLEKGQREGVFRPGLDPTDVYLTLASMCYHVLSNQYTLEIALNRNFGATRVKSKWLDHIVDVISMYCMLEPVHRPSEKEKTQKNALTAAS